MKHRTQRAHRLFLRSPQQLRPVHVQLPTKLNCKLGVSTEHSDQSRAPTTRTCCRILLSSLQRRLPRVLRLLALELLPRLPVIALQPSNVGRQERGAVECAVDFAVCSARCSPWRLVSPSAATAAATTPLPRLSHAQQLTKLERFGDTRALWQCHAGAGGHCARPRQARPGRLCHGLPGRRHAGGRVRTQPAGEQRVAVACPAPGAAGPGPAGG